MFAEPLQPLRVPGVLLGVQSDSREGHMPSSLPHSPRAGVGGSGKLKQFPFRFDLLLDIKAWLWLSEMNAAANAIPQDEISLHWVIPASF